MGRMMPCCRARPEDSPLAEDAEAGVFALGAAVAGDAEPGQGQDHDDYGRGDQQRQGDHDQRRDGDDEGERSTAAALAAAGAVNEVADHDAAERGAERGEQRADDPVDQEPGDEADHGGQDRHPAPGGAVGAGGAGEHADRDADAEVGEEVHARNLTICEGGASIRHTSPMAEVPEPTHRRRSHAGTRDLERYAGLFAERTGVMRSSAMRDLMAITARPEVISLAGGLPDTSTFPPQSFAAQMTRIAQKSAAEALQYGPTEGFEETKDCILEVMGAEGMLPDPDDVIVTTGGQQAIDLVCKTLLDPGDVVICEAPTYPGAIPTLCSYQADVVQVECDEDGMRVELLERLLGELREEGRRP